jgi:hypothetical protein
MAAAIQRHPLREDDGLMRDFGKGLKLIHFNLIGCSNRGGNVARGAADQRDFD